MTSTLKRYGGPIFGFWVLAEIVASILLLFHLDPLQSGVVRNILLPFEVMIAIPGLVYFFFIRKRTLTPLLVLPISYAGGLVTTQLVQPTDLSFVLGCASFMLLVEITIAVHEFTRFVRRFNEIRATSDDPFLWFSESFYELFQNRRVSKLVSMELTTMYYAFFTWGKKNEKVSDVACFSYHEKSGYSALIAVLIGVSVIEIVVMHMLLSQWSMEAAFVVTIFSVYFLFWLLGDLRASILRPVKVEGSTIVINSGIRVSARIPVNMIESIGSKDPELGKKLTLNLAMMGNSDCWIILKEPVKIEGFFGGKQARQAIGLTLDDTAGFKKAIAEAQE